MNNDQILNEEDIKKIKNELIARREQITKDLRDIVNNADGTESTKKVKFPEYGDKLDENAQEIDEYTTNLATDRVLEGTIRDIDKALERIEKGEYGICKYCHNPIAKKRMQARPVASACVECKTKLQNQF